ncbi:MAG: hypothetical protein R3D03_13430 [Geminicoccaceae bacterium]
MNTALPGGPDLVTEVGCKPGEEVDGGIGDDGAGGKIARAPAASRAS